MTQVTISSSNADTVGEDGGFGSAPASSSRAQSFLDPARPLLTYAGVALTLIGFILVLIAWSKVAGQTNVALQTPYLVSAGFTGLGLIMTGLLIINIAAKRRDAYERTRQTNALTEALHNLQRSLDDR